MGETPSCGYIADLGIQIPRGASSKALATTHRVGEEIGVGGKGIALSMDGRTMIVVVALDVVGIQGRM